MILNRWAIGLPYIKDDNQSINEDNRSMKEDNRSMKEDNRELHYR